MTGFGTERHRLGRRQVARTDVFPAAEQEQCAERSEHGTGWLGDDGEGGFEVGADRIGECCIRGKTDGLAVIEAACRSAGEIDAVENVGSGHVGSAIFVGQHFWAGEAECVAVTGIEGAEIETVEVSRIARATAAGCLGVIPDRCFAEVAGGDVDVGPEDPGCGGRLM